MCIPILYLNFLFVLSAHRNGTFSMNSIMYNECGVRERACECMCVMCMQAAVDPRLLSDGEKLVERDTFPPICLLLKWLFIKVDLISFFMD